MLGQRQRPAVLELSVFAFLALFPFCQTAMAQTSATVAKLKVAGAVSTPLTPTGTDLKNMPRTTLRVMNPMRTNPKPTRAYSSRSCCEEPAFLRDTSFAEN